MKKPTKTTAEALAELHAKAGYTGPKKAAPVAKPTMADNYATLGKKMAKSGQRALGKK